MTEHWQESQVQTNENGPPGLAGQQAKLPQHLCGTLPSPESDMAIAEKIEQGRTELRRLYKGPV